MRLALSILLLVSSAMADIVQPSNRVDWIVGRTVGVQGDYGTRTNLIDVTQAPYSADKTGATDASTAITDAITAAVSNDVVYFPDGIYQVSGIALRKSGITLRGQSTNAILRCTTSSSIIAMGHGTNGTGQWTNITGAVKGSTNFVFVGTNLPANRVGNIMGLQTENVTDEHFQVISTGNAEKLIEQEVVIHSINGATVNLTAPLVWDFTNNPVIYDNGDLFVGMGIENLTLSYTNRETGDVGSNAYLIYTWSLRDCWIKGCVIEWTKNYAVYAGWSANCEFVSNIVCNAQSAGANHSGLLLKKCSGWLVADNIFRDGLQPGIEIEVNTVGCAFVGNFFTNNYLSMDFDIHNTHPMMNLFEQNRCTGYWISDGYFGSASHFTLFRNAIENVGSTQPLRIKRWNSYHQIVGNVLGNSNTAYGSESAIMEFGYPSMGNSSYTGDSPPMGWNWPQNPIFTLTNEVTGTNLPGIWTNVTTASRLIFQDSADTNSYWPWSGTIVPFADGTSSNLLVTTSMTYSNGWTAYAVSTSAWDQRQLTNRSTFTMHGNWDYFNNAVVWDAGIADHAIPSSLIYTSKPAWWGSLDWPAIGSDLTPMVKLIPAQARYLGIDYSGNSPATNAPSRRASRFNAHILRVK